MFVLTLGFFATPVIAQRAGIDAGAAIAKDEFSVLGRATTAATLGFTADADAALTNAPDLAELLMNGGTIELQLELADNDAAAEAAKDMSLWQKAVITEVMWGRDEPPATAGEEDDRQWIEIYNFTGSALTPAYTAAADPAPATNGIRLVYYRTASNTDPATAIDEDFDATTADNITWVLVDRVSTTNRFGTRWDPLGQSGNTVADVTPPTPISSLKSMYRKINLDAGKYKVASGKLDGLGDGREAGSWAESEGRINMVGNYVGSPRSPHVLAGGLVMKFDKAPASISGTGVIINEVRNDTSEANLDWVELFYNTDDTSATSQNVENWELSIITATKNDDGTYKDFADTSLAVLPKHKMQPGEYLVVYNRDPGKSVKLAGGINVEDVAAGTQVNKGASHLYVVRDGLDLPGNKMFLIILRTRNHNDDVGKPTHVKDYAGNGFFPRIEANKFNTDVWPFVGWTKPDVEGFGDPTFGSRDMSWGRIAKLNANGEYWSDPSGNRLHGDHWAPFGFMGAGYDRGAGKIIDPETSPGTPGYPNVAVNVIADDKDTSATKDDYAFSGVVSISEIMYDAGPRWSLVQWIELYNSSMTETIKLDGWELEIRNEATDIETYVDSIIEFAADTMIPPNQTLLVVSSTSGAKNNVPDNYVYNLTENHPKELGVKARGKRLLSNTGFHLTLRAKVNVGGETEMMVVDEVGNVMVDGAARIHEWDLPAEEADSNIRASITRVYGEVGAGGREIDGTNDGNSPSPGTMEESWKPALVSGAVYSYYGSATDIGSPGFRLGGPLPVSLSSFRPARDKATGEVVIRWITESELNNAGFNILRSETKTGEFKVVNLKGLIPGHGTTSEKHVYEWKDTSAKPNVVYYYQIEDVSLDGKRTPLATTHLRGNVNAAGKVTTTWGDLKTQQ